jgi:hypothetical protein
MTVHALVVFPIGDRVLVRAALERALNISFEERDSTYLGPYERYPPFSRRESGAIEIRLRNNVDGFGDVTVESHPNASVIAEVSASSVPELQRILDVIKEHITFVQASLAAIAQPPSPAVVENASSRLVEEEETTLKSTNDEGNSAPTSHPPKTGSRS